jgi:predicted O-linked N-acetylglucosamine transferase (SPINDLY family)
VAGHTTGARFAITAQRPARVQVLYLAFPGTLGSHRVDFAIVDRIVAPNSSEWTESLVHLPSTYYLYDFRARSEQNAVSRADYGLPDKAFVYCAFHKAEKITPDAFLLWAQVLLQVPRSVLWCLALPDGAKANLRREAAAHGVDPGRLAFAPFESRERYLARQCLGDLLLDAVHHCAMTTACDALGAGLPMLTMQGSTMASRAGESLLRAAGLPELVATDPEAYVETAVRLARERDTLGQFRERLARNRSTAPLFDTADRVHSLEVCFEQMVQVL